MEKFGWTSIAEASWCLRIWQRSLCVSLVHIGPTTKLLDLDVHPCFSAAVSKKLQNFRSRIWPEVNYVALQLPNLWVGDGFMGLPAQGSVPVRKPFSYLIFTLPPLELTLPILTELSNQPRRRILWDDHTFTQVASPYSNIWNSPNYRAKTDVRTARYATMTQTKNAYGCPHHTHGQDLKESQIFRARNFGAASSYST